MAGENLDEIGPPIVHSQGPVEREKQCLFLALCV